MTVAGEFMGEKFIRRAVFYYHLDYLPLEETRGDG